MAPADDDLHFMALALQQAQLAAAAGEIPVGAVVVKDGVVIGVGCNAPIGLHDPTAHAEIVALRAAASQLGNYRLDGCTLYVTLEPCSMCSGAVLQARLARIVYGAAEPKTGAAGSVFNLFQTPALNHQTRVDGGVLADACADLLRTFFLERRRLQKQSAWPLREDALRTPERAFDVLPAVDAASCYVSDLPALNGLRMHYFDAGAADSPLVFFCVHGQGAWGWQYLPLLAAAHQRSCRVIAPDLIGFGKSDKPKREAAHTEAFHRRTLCELLEHLDLSSVVLVIGGGAGASWGLNVLPEAAARIAGLVACPPGDSTDAENASFRLPFPDAGHQAALRALPVALPLRAETTHFLQTQWRGPTLLLRTELPPLTGANAVDAMLRTSGKSSASSEGPGICTPDLDCLFATLAGT